jgi:hypothetical protein
MGLLRWAEKVVGVFVCVFVRRFILRVGVSERGALPRAGTAVEDLLPVRLTLLLPGGPDVTSMETWLAFRHFSS